MNAIDRQTAAAHVRKGWPVLVGGRLVTKPAEMPPPPAEGTSEPPGQFVATRHPSGHFTRDGLVAIINGGGTVLHHGTLIERVEDLPPEEELAAGDTVRLDAVEASIDEQIAKLHAQKVSVERERNRQPPSPAATQEGTAPTGQQPHTPAPTPTSPPHSPLPAPPRQPPPKGK